MGKWFLVFFLFLILGLSIYHNSFNNKFLIDDNVFIANPVMSQTKFILSQWNPFQEQGLGVLDTSGKFPYYRPLAHIASILSRIIFKHNLWRYHLFNIFIFVFASSLVYLLIDKITGNNKLAFLSGLFYVIHPINGIAVDYILPGSSFAFMVIFMLGTILLLWESLLRKNNLTLYILSIVFCFLSLFWNENGVMIAFYVLAFILLFRQDTLKEKMLYFVPYFLIIFTYLILRLNFFGLNEHILEKIMRYHMTIWEFPAILFRVFGWYISNLFYPRSIVMLWSTPVLHDQIILNLFGAFLLFTLFLLLLIKFSKEKICYLAIVWILIGFAPACLAAFREPDNGVMIEPQWFVFSSIGFFILTAFFCLNFFNRFKKAGLVLLLVLISFWGSASYKHNQLWANQKTYALYWSQQVPNLTMPYFFIAEAYTKEGNLKEARKYYRMILSTYSNKELIYINLGRIDQAEGYLKDAEINYKMALKVYPYSAIAYDNLGTIYYAEDRLDKAKDSFNHSLLIDPLFLDPRIGLASILIKHSQYKEAVKLCLTNLNIVNDDSNTLLMLIEIFIYQNDLINLKKYVHLFIHSESDPALLMRLGIHLLKDNFPSLALDCFERVLRVAPDYKDAYLVVGTLFANMGKLNEAIHIWKLGSKIDPSDQRFRNSIVKAESLKLN